MLKNRLFLLALVLISLILLSYRLTDVPTGLTVDESAFGWNATLLSRTGHDENGAFLPIFVNSIDKKDWRQPFTQYYQAIFFKLFGSSIFNLRFSSVILIIFSALLVYYLITLLLGQIAGYFGFTIFILTPVIFMHSHLGLDNIMPIPFTLLWLISLYKYYAKANFKSLYLAGLFLGCSFYTYKGMRAIAPVWIVISYLYILYLNHRPKISLLKLVNSSLPFIYGFLPFFLIIPLLSHYYPGAIFGGARPKFDNIYDFFYPYLSSFDLTFLFVKGDDLLFHSTKIHGMLLLSTFPLLILGIFQSFKQKKSFWSFISLALLIGPILYGFVGSTHRASRILCLVPLFIVLTSLGFVTSIKVKFSKIFLPIFSVIILLNFIDFARYYWFTYPKFTENIFGNMSRNNDYRIFAEQSKIYGLKSYVDNDIYEGFFDSIYFTNPSVRLTEKELPPTNSIYLTPHSNLDGFEKLNIDLPNFNIYLIR